MKRAYLFIWLASLLLLVLAALGIESPGYMDADYYFATGQQVAQGQGFTQSFLWHYLDDPSSLPHASHGYWMPLTTLVAALPMWLLKVNDFRVAQIPFVLLTSLLPVAAVYLADRFHGQRRWAIMSGLLALFSGFYFIFFLTTDNFTLYVWIGGLVLWLAARLGDKAPPWKWALLGGLIGLAHMTRADGILLLIGAFWAAWRANRPPMWAAFGLVLAGLAIVELPWWLRNIDLYQSLFSPSNGRVLWLTNYNELFTYPAEQLTPEHWLQSGIPAILQSRLEALWLNLQHALAEPGMVFLWPFVLVAMRKYRLHRWVQISTAYFITMFLVMTIVFPYAGGRGGVFHSSAALLPLVWVLAPMGLARTIGWAAEKRSWRTSQAQAVFQSACVSMMALLTLGLYLSQAVDTGGSGSDWDISDGLYRRVGEVLEENDLDDVRVAVNNPPGFWLATGLEAVVIPNGDEAALRDVVRQFDVDIVVLDRNVPSGLEDLMDNPEQLDWLEVIARVDRPFGRLVWILKVHSP